jgi:hypothetical protein
VGNRGSRRRHAQPRPGHLHPRPRQLYGQRQQHRQQDGCHPRYHQPYRSNYGAIDIRAGSTIEISAPALGAAAGIPGIAIWVDDEPAAGDTFDGGRTQNINGAIYLPGLQVNYSGGSPAATRCSQLIARAVTFAGSSYFRHDCRGAGVFEAIGKLRARLQPRSDEREHKGLAAAVADGTKMSYLLDG